ncbi:glycosyltransferase [Actinokineospora bangkokensis]|uniref:Glycosyl transferase n=1 Tax=Actinokineospora bangkokensis TaxID=1193682 RepID=A0A1Q9LC84_9PSEU|nr:glycosyltransferase [Actinokineospora bangkokensis]OLR89641.1 hypothetical protein BJP25_04775 [Actinokineospora bangkokensis]
MDLLFSSLPSHGHTYPLLPLAIAARDAGHHVTYATAADFHPLLRALGFDVLDVGLDIRGGFAVLAERTPGAGAADPRAHHKLSPEQAARNAAVVFTEILPERFFADLGAVFESHRPDLVVYEAAALGAGLAAKKAGLPAVCHGFGRGFDPEQADRLALGFREGFTATVRKLLGDDTDFDAMSPGTGDPYLDIYPPSIQTPSVLAAPHRLPLRPVPFAEPGDLPAWVTAHEQPLVYLTLGTAFGDHEVLRTAIDGLASTGARVLVAAGPTVETADLGDPPANVTVEAWVPQADLLPHLDLVVHHGGSGTTLGSIGAGVPQLFLPQGADQFTNAAAVSGFGAGRTLEGDAVTREGVAAAARELLADVEVAGKVKVLADEVAGMPAPAEVVARLGEFATT